ncbi:UPF0280 family protein [Candidatus Bathyarchaeota archaeon]|nr:UPF0280 family protein [Candidatus Bathyarchaeota archaeon]
MPPKIKIGSKTLYEHRFIIGYSKICVKSDLKEAVPKACEKIKHHIEELFAYVKENPRILYALEPLDIRDSNAPPVIRRMIHASKTANVGPMASVAGAIADLGLEALLENGATIAVVEDGGEVSAYTSEPIPISIITGEERLSGKIGFLITKDDSPVGIATSTGKTERVINFGEADAVTVVAENAAVADAAATSICNAVTGINVKESILKGLERAKKIRGVRGAIIVRDGKIGFSGKLPKIIRIK